MEGSRSPLPCVQVPAPAQNPKPAAACRCLQPSSHTLSHALHLCRCLRLSLYGLLIDGPIGHQWYKLLDKHVFPRAPTSLRAVLTKTAADQLLWAPVMTGGAGWGVRWVERLGGACAGVAGGEELVLR